MIDYHIHTFFCGHAVGEPKSYVEKAIELGCKEMGFADHFPLLKNWESDLTMLEEELPVYVEMVRKLDEKYKEIEIKLGIEVDYLPECMEKTERILEQFPFDYVYCSVHYIGDWGFDNPSYREYWDHKNVTDVYLQYYSLLKEAVSTGIFDIITHFDLVKKFGHRPERSLDKEVKSLVDTIKKQKMAVEVNTSGLRVPAEELYPSEKILKWCQEKSIPVVTGSDAHFPDHVAKDFDSARRVLKKVGYKKTAVFKNREITRQIDL
jgi:histidinol-phosphatase (PHP family)